MIYNINRNKKYWRLNLQLNSFVVMGLHDIKPVLLGLMLLIITVIHIHHIYLVKCNLDQINIHQFMKMLLLFAGLFTIYK